MKALAVSDGDKRMIGIDRRATAQDKHMATLTDIITSTTAFLNLGIR